MRFDTAKRGYSATLRDETPAGAQYPFFDAIAAANQDRVTFFEQQVENRNWNIVSIDTNRVELPNKLERIQNQLDHQIGERADPLLVPYRDEKNVKEIDIHRIKVDTGKWVIGK